MDRKEFSPQTLVRITQPLNLGIILFTYALGLGVVDYLGHAVDWPVATLGSLIVLAMLLAHSFLSAYYGYPDPIHACGISRTDDEGTVRFIEVKEVPRHVLLQMALAALGLGTIAVVVLMIEKAFSISGMLIAGLGLVLVILDVLPPVQLRKRGYSEGIEAMLVAVVSPALAFLLQVNELHILVFMLSLPLTCLYLALQVASTFEYYAYDTKHAAGTLLSIAGWQRGISVHNLSIGLAFFLYAIFLVFKLPWALTWPIFLALPLGVLQIVQMTQIGDGARPNWRLFRMNSLATFLLVVYLITFRLWSL